jgi:hypothetical protein
MLKIVYGIIVLVKKEGTHFERVRVMDLPNSRRGKHFALRGKIMEDLANTPSGTAVMVPLENIGGVGLANLRSAVNRAARARGLKIETQSDEKYLYVWKGSKQQTEK